MNAPQGTSNPPKCKRYTRHNCTRSHRTVHTLARCTWPRAHWIAGGGQFASVAYCRGTTVMLWPTAEAAHEARRDIDAYGCGGACVRRHDVIELVTA